MKFSTRMSVIVFINLTIPGVLGGYDMDNVDPGGRYGYGGGEGNHGHIVAEFLEPVSRDAPLTPLFYGFFYGFNVSESLKLIAERYLAASYTTVPEFANFLDKLVYQTNTTNPYLYYQKPADPSTGKMDPYYHTTAKFCGHKDCLDYWNKAGKYLGKPFEMHLVGLFFTQRTFGIRVKLTAEEQKIFDMDERSNSVQVAEEELFETLANRSSKYVNETETTHEYEPYFHIRSNKTVDDIRTHSYYPGIYFYPQKPDFHPTESRAHITLGCAPNVEAVQTGLDLLTILDLEVSGHIYQHDFQIGGGDIPLSTLRQFGGDGDEMEELFVVYPSEEMITEATFSVYL